MALLEMSWPKLDLTSSVKNIMASFEIHTWTFCRNIYDYRWEG